MQDPLRTELMQTCARCGGHFPGPGVERDGKIYCCDMCAAGPKQMWPRMALRMLPIAAVLLGVGVLIGRHAGTTLRLPLRVRKLKG